MGNGIMSTSLTRLFWEFYRSEQASGVVLLTCTVFSVMLANSPLAVEYLALWHTEIGFSIGPVSVFHDLEHWINDGLMAVFFLLIGLEIERELYIGEISSLRKAILPAVAALGGMAAPAAIHFMLNGGTPAQAGIGIPIATDIAFSLGILSLLGSRVPLFLKVFLTAMAIMDDLGAIVVIAVFYARDFSPPDLLVALGIFGFMLLLNRLRVHALTLYLIPGVFMWHFMFKSGVHATIAGVLLAFAIPFGSGDADSPSYRLQHFLHKPVPFLIMPLFALANTGIAFSGDVAAQLLTLNSIGIFTGLALGKPIGIVLFTAAAAKIGLGRLPEGVKWRNIVGIGFLGGIGFTMSIFITLLAFEDPAVIRASKIAVLAGSVAAGVAGYLILRHRDGTEPETRGTA